MGYNMLRLLAFFSLSTFIFSEKPHLEGNQKSIPYQKDKTLISSSIHFTQLEDIPIVNPTTPGTTNPTPTPTPTLTPTTPIINPTSPPAPIFEDPNINPITPIMPAPTTTTPTTGTNIPGSSGGGGGSWCIANSGASPTSLQVALDYACGYGGADCSAIQPGGGCYEPNTMKDHASYAFNDYYQKNPVPTSCVFGGAAQLTNTDPSSGNCHYATPRATPSISPPANPTPTPMLTPPTMPSPLPPATTIPTMDTPPTDSSIFGLEPTGMPNSATSLSKRSLLLFTTTYLLGSFVANHL